MHSVMTIHRFLKAFTHISVRTHSSAIFVVRDLVLQADPGIGAERVVRRQPSIHGQILCDQCFPACLEANGILAVVVGQIISTAVKVLSVLAKQRNRATRLKVESGVRILRDLAPLPEHVVAAESKIGQQCVTQQYGIITEHEVSIASEIDIAA